MRPGSRREATGLEEAHALCLETLVTALLGQDRLPEAAERARRLRRAVSAA